MFKSLSSVGVGGGQRWGEKEEENNFSQNRQQK